MKKPFRGIYRETVFWYVQIASLIFAEFKKRYAITTAQQVAENVLNREFHADEPNEMWLTDVTEFKYGPGQKAYLSAILDLYDKSIVSYVLGSSNNNPPVVPEHVPSWTMHR
ncbi:hypothetical protein MRBLPE1_003042 [Paenibacillus sp. LPE1-1-1.1]